MNSAALYDALNCASLAVLAVEDWDHPKAETALLEASVAASEAYPLDSDESRALVVVLGAIGTMVYGAAR